MKLEDKFNEIMDQFEIIKIRHAKFVERGNKTAEADVRKALGKVKNMVTEYRKLSVEATKK